MADLWLTPDEVAELTARIRRPACIPISGKLQPQPRHRLQRCFGGQVGHVGGCDKRLTLRLRHHRVRIRGLSPRDRSELPAQEA